MNECPACGYLWDAQHGDPTCPDCGWQPGPAFAEDEPVPHVLCPECASLRLLTVCTWERADGVAGVSSASTEVECRDCGHAFDLAAS